jgi:hypothetical protein
LFIQLFYDCLVLSFPIWGFFLFNVVFMFIRLFLPVFISVFLFVCLLVRLYNMRFCLFVCFFSVCLFVFSNISFFSFRCRCHLMVGTKSRTVKLFEVK